MPQLHKQFNVIGNAIAAVKMKKDYAIKVWGSTILAAPVLMMVVTAIIATKKGSGFDTGALGFILFAVIGGLVLSLPTFAITYFLFPILFRKVQTVITVKLIMLLIGLTSIVATFYFSYGGEGYNLNGNYAALTFSLSYSICLVIFSLIYPAGTKKALPITTASMQ